MPLDQARPDRSRVETNGRGPRKGSAKPSGDGREPVLPTLTAPPQERQLTPAMALAIQRTAGNAALTQLLQPRESATTSPHPALLHDTPVVQRYQAGEPGHGGIEADALHQAGFGGTMTEGEIGKTYFGNWMRDFSQVGNAHDPKMLLVLNVLAMGEFNRQLTAEDIGGYVPSEHLDRPTAGVTKADVGEAALPAMGKKDEASLSDAQRLWIKEEQDRSFKEMIRQRAAASHLPTYIEVGK